MPFTDKDQAELDSLELEKLEEERSSRRWALDETPLQSAQRGRHGGVGIDMLLEAGIPMVAQAAATETGPGGQAVIGSGLSVIGNVLAQTRRVLMGEQEGFSGGQIAQAAATGAVPFGPAAKAASARPVLRSIVDAGVSATKSGAVGVGGEAIKTAIDEGRLPTAREAVVAGSIPGVIGGAASGIGSVAKGIATRGRRVAENLADYGTNRASSGMLLPEDLAATEQRLARERPGGQISSRVDAAYQDMSDQVQGIAPNPKEGAEIFDMASPLLGQISKTQDELSKLNSAAQKANERARQAAQKVRGALAVSDKESSEAAFEAAQKWSNEAFDANLGSALENAKEIATTKITGGAQGIDSATARTLFVEHVAKPIEAAFDEKSAQMYSLVNGESKVFDSKPIISKAQEIASKASGKLPAKLESSVKSVSEMLGDGEAVSLQDLRNVRAELLKKAQIGGLGSYEEKLIKDVAHEITSQIDSQASRALGKESGDALKAANKFYSETRPLFDQRGVDVLFSTGTADEFSRTMLSGMEKAGIKSDEYKNLQNLISKIGEFNPELAKAAQSHVQDTLRRSIIFDASRVNPASIDGGLMVDSAALVDRLDKMARVPGTLEALNLGTPAKIAELKKLMASYPEASKMGSREWEALLDSPAFKQATASGELSTLLAPVMAASQAEAQLVKAVNLRAGGKIERANAAYDSALETVKKINGDVAAARARYEELLKDPAAVALNNPGISDSGFNAFSNSLFNPKASAVTNTDVRAIADALRTSSSPQNRELLKRLQERYIADKIASYHSTPPSSQMLQHPDSDSVALFFNPINPRDATNEIDRARALLEPEQLNALSAFSRTARAIGKYERFGVVPVKAGSYDIPVVGQIRRGLDAIADLYREGKYEIAARLLANPSEFARYSTKVGEVGMAASRTLGTSAQGVGRAVDDRR